MVDVLNYISICLNICMFLRWIYLAIETKKYLKNYVDDMNKKYDEFYEKCNKDIDVAKEQASERMNLLSRENNKLREQKEKLEDKLRDLGIKNFD